MIKNKNLKNVLFFRNFQGFTGGHLKVWHYFNHLKTTDNYAPSILFSKNSVWDETNPWLSIKDQILISENEIEPDIAFLAGLDWLEWQKIDKKIPIVNLVQGIRHVDKNLPLYSFLKNKAIRICVSQQVQEALLESKQVNGPIYTIPVGVNKNSFPNVLPFEERSIDILIAGLKNNEIAQSLYDRLIPLNKQVKILTKPILQREYLSYVNQAKIAVFLPMSEEGFYLPPLESMLLDTLVICPDCIGNRSFCLPDFNCFQPDYSVEGLLNAITRALALSKQDKDKMILNAKSTAAEYTLERERQKFLEIMNNITHIW